MLQYSQHILKRLNFTLPNKSNPMALTLLLNTYRPTVQGMRCACFERKNFHSFDSLSDPNSKTIKIAFKNSITELEQYIYLALYLAYLVFMIYPSSVKVLTTLAASTVVSFFRVELLSPPCNKTFPNYCSFFNVPKKMQKKCQKFSFFRIAVICICKMILFAK